MSTENLNENITEDKNDNKTKPNFIKLLNGLRSRICYQIIDNENQEFTISVMVDGKTYIGKGSTEAIAKNNAAEAALKSNNIIVNCNFLKSQFMEIWKKLNFKLEENNAGTEVKMSVKIDGRLYYSRGTSERIVKIQIMSEILKMIRRWKKSMLIYTEKCPTLCKIREIYSALRFNRIEDLQQLQELQKLKELQNLSSKVVFIQMNGHKYFGKGGTRKLALLQASASIFTNYHNLPIDNNEKEIEEEILYRSCLNVRKTKSGKILALLYFVRKQLQFNNNTENIDNSDNDNVIDDYIEEYNVSVKIDDKTFSGKGVTEQFAKIDAMKHALIFIKNKKLSYINNKSLMYAIHRIRSGIIYNIDRLDGIFADKFTTYISLNGEIYMGKGDTSPLARLEAIANVLTSPNNTAADIFKLKHPGYIPLKKRPNINDVVSSLCNVTANIQQSLNSSNKNENVEASMRINDKEIIASGSDNKLANINVTLQAIVELCRTISSKKSADKIKTIEKNVFPDKLSNVDPILLLQNLSNKPIKYDVDSNYLLENNKFKITAIIDKLEFNGFGRSEQIAKAAAAKEALINIYKLSYPNDELTEEFANEIERLIADKFIELMKNARDDVGRNVIAGIVMTKNLNINSAKVVALSSGTQRVDGGPIYLNGTVLYDTHAEILTRRSLIKYLYDQLKLHFQENNDADNSIFEITNNQMYKIKDNIKFHMYVSHPPCGDVSISGSTTEKLKGLLQLKDANDTMCLKNKQTQNWTDISQGNQLLVMSCSDKIAKWNVVGIQGSLLSNIIEPVYLHSIILGSSKCMIDLYRGTYGRLENSLLFSRLPMNYHFNKPMLIETKISSSDCKQSGKSTIMLRIPNQNAISNYAFNWVYNNSMGEFINLLTGKVNDDGLISSISKLSLFKEYEIVVNTLSIIDDKRKNLKFNYGELKSTAIKYQKAKEIMYKAFSCNDLGYWLKKPNEVENFSLDCDVKTALMNN